MDDWLQMLNDMKEAALPLIEKMISDDEYHNEYTKMHHVLGWRQVIWFKEDMETHGWQWINGAWTRSEEDRVRSLSFVWRRGKPRPAVLQPQAFQPDFLYNRLPAPKTAPPAAKKDTRQLSLF